MRLLPRNKEYLNGVYAGQSEKQFDAKKSTEWQRGHKDGQEYITGFCANFLHGEAFDGTKTKQWQKGWNHGGRESELSIMVDYLT